MSVQYVTALGGAPCYVGGAMDETEPAHDNVKAAAKTGRLAYLVEFLAIVALTAFAAYGAS